MERAWVFKQQLSKLPFYLPPPSPSGQFSQQLQCSFCSLLSKLFRQQGGDPRSKCICTSMVVSHPYKCLASSSRRLPPPWHPSQTSWEDKNLPRKDSTREAKQKQDHTCPSTAQDVPAHRSSFEAGPPCSPCQCWASSGAVLSGPRSSAPSAPAWPSCAGSSTAGRWWHPGPGGSECGPASHGQTSGEWWLCAPQGSTKHGHKQDNQGRSHPQKVAAALVWLQAWHSTLPNLPSKGLLLQAGVSW